MTEGPSAKASFTVRLSAASVSTVTVAYATADGTAIHPADYAQTSGTLTFTPGQTTKTVDVPVVNDALDEADETFTLVLSGPSNAVLGDGSGAAKIIDFDDPPSMSIGDVTVTEGTGPGTTNAVFTVTLSAASGQAVSAAYATSNGTATQPADYTQTTGTVSFSAGQTTRTISVPVTRDSFDEVNENFSVTLSSPVNASLTPINATGDATINDDDELSAPLTVSVADTSAIEQLDPDAVFTVSLSEPSSAAR